MAMFNYPRLDCFGRYINLFINKHGRLPLPTNYNLGRSYLSQSHGQAVNLCAKRCHSVFLEPNILSRRAVRLDTTACLSHKSGERKMKLFVLETVNERVDATIGEHGDVERTTEVGDDV